MACLCSKIPGQVGAERQQKQVYSLAYKDLTAGKYCLFKQADLISNQNVGQKFILSQRQTDKAIEGTCKKSKKNTFIQILWEKLENFMISLGWP